MMPWPRPHRDQALKPGPACWSRAIQRVRRSRVFGWDGNPLRRAQADEWVAVCEVVTAPGLLFVFVLAGCAGRWMLTRRRLGGWDEAWRAVGPQWTRHG